MCQRRMQAALLFADYYGHITMVIFGSTWWRRHQIMKHVQFHLQRVIMCYL